MPRNGMAPKPRSQLASWRKDLYPNQPNLSGVELQVPERLKLTREEQQEWVRLARVLHKGQLTTELDEHALLELVKTITEERQVNKKLKGRLVVDGVNGPQRNPLYEVRKDLRARLDKLFIEFGMTPSARTRVVVVSAPKVPKNVSPIGELLGENRAS